eukprot:g28558.t1
MQTTLKKTASFYSTANSMTISDESMPKFSNAGLIYSFEPCTMPAARPVICKETGEIFPSTTAAAKHVKRAQSAIMQALRTEGQCAGYHWLYLDMQPATENPAESA